MSLQASPFDSQDDSQHRESRRATADIGGSSAVSIHLGRTLQMIVVSETRVTRWSEEHGWKERALGLLIDPCRHHVHDVKEAQVMREAPAQELSVSQRDEEAGSVEILCTPDERLKVVVRFGNRVSAERDCSCVTRDASMSLDDSGSALGDRIAQLPVAVEAMNAFAYCIACSDLGKGRRPHGKTRDLEVERISMNRSERFAYVETKLCVQAQ
jgi:hypothetical protein